MMSQKIKSIFKHILDGMIVGLFIFLAFIGSLYGVKYVNAREKVDTTEQKIESFVNKGYYSVQEYEDLIEKAQNMFDGSYISYQKLQEIEEHSNIILQELEEEYQAKLNQKVELFDEKVSVFKQDLQESDELGVENLDSFKGSVPVYDYVFEKRGIELREVETMIDRIEDEHETLLEEMDEAKKQQIYEQVRQKIKEVEELKKFFDDRSGWAEEKKVLADFEKKTTDILGEQVYADLSFIELEEFVESDVYPLIDVAKQNKQKVLDEEERLRLEAEKRKKEEKERRKKEEEERQKAIADLKSGKWIYINIASQKMYAYNGNSLYLSTPITSGADSTPTVRGQFSIYTKTRGRYLCGPGYCLWVDYWMPFYYGYGIHDSCNSIDCWRSSFGGNDYHWNGSHGCVNTPYNAVAMIYNWAPIGTPVFVD